MAWFLVTVTLGPVQSLIEAARRTRDLWCGSWLLSEASRAAARVLHEAQPGCLIFPCPEDPEHDLLPKADPGDEANIANVLRALVELQDRHAAARLCADARRAADARLRALGGQARKRLNGSGASLRAEVWDAQIGDILESFAAWVEVPDLESDYATASRQLGSALAARKATRDFAPCAPLATAGLPKSSLDGTRETVLPEWPPGHVGRRKLGLSAGEQLDALGVMKRMAVGAEQFTAYSRIAADPWLEGLGSEQQARIRDAYEPLMAPGLATRVRGNDGIYAAIPYDAQLLYDFRLQNALADGTVPKEAVPALEALRSVLNGVTGQRTAAGDAVGQPVPYAVILKADGDRMGKLLSAARTAAESRDISRRLHAFASAVRRIVREHRGHAIYAGGDDVLALLPLSGALDCAQALAQSFRGHMEPIAASLGTPADESPTLSVGLGIGHLMEPLGSLRARAERAEKAAKDDGKGPERNALAIALGVRAGSEYGWRAQWTDRSAFDALKAFTLAFRAGTLPSRVAYDVGAIDRRLSWLRDDSDAEAGGMRGAEVSRMLDRARSEAGSREVPRPTRRLVVERAEAQPLADLAQTLIIARWLSARTATDLGERP